MQKQLAYPSWCRTDLIMYCRKRVLSGMGKICSGTQCRWYSLYCARNQTLAWCSTRKLFCTYCRKCPKWKCFKPVAWSSGWRRISKIEIKQNDQEGIPDRCLFQELFWREFGNFRDHSWQKEALIIIGSCFLFTGTIMLFIYEHIVNSLFFSRKYVIMRSEKDFYEKINHYILMFDVNHIIRMYL